MLMLMKWGGVAMDSKQKYHQRPKRRLLVTSKNLHQVIKVTAKHRKRSMSALVAELIDTGLKGLNAGY
jgi:hypothetical protein